MSTKGLITIGLAWFAAVVIWLRFFDKGFSHVWMAPSVFKRAVLVVGLCFLTFVYSIFLIGWLVPLGFGIYRFARHR